MAQLLVTPQTSGSQGRIRIEYLPIDSVTLDPRNARCHPKWQVRQIQQSMRRFGFNVAVVVDAQGKLICGHGRYLAAKAEGLTEIPVVRIEHLSEAEARAFAIADNKLTENASWDDQLLAESLKELTALNLDFSLDITGFAMPEIDLRIEGLENVEAADDADATPAPGVPVTKKGHYWRLGDHLLGCGSATDGNAYEPLLEVGEAAMVFADPPWNLKVDGCISTGTGKVKHREFVSGSGEMEAAEFIRFLRDTTTLMAKYSRDGAINQVCIDWRHVADLIDAGKSAYTELKNICVWVKHNAGLGSFYRSQHELVVIFKVGHAPHRNNIDLGRHGRHRSNVWRYPGVTPFGAQTDEGNLLALHPTVKPVRMVSDAILDCTARGDIVLDPFMGSGSTLIACERTGRRCRGMDLDPLYVDTAVRRWQAWTGEQAVHVESGKAFAELEAERETVHEG